jgi:hypothetical protein
VLIAPATEPYTGRLFFELTGRWHIDDLLGFMLELGALVSSNIAAIMRMPTVSVGELSAPGRRLCR